MVAAASAFESSGRPEGLALFDDAVAAAAGPPPDDTAGLASWLSVIGASC